MDKHVLQLEKILREQYEIYQQLHVLLLRKQKALRKAERRQVMQLCELENKKVQLISKLEKTRLELMGRFTETLDPDALEPLKLLQLAERLSDPVRDRLLVLCTQRRQMMQDVQHQAQVTRQATESLFRHMQGLVLKISTVCSGVATYGQKGSVPGATLAVSTFSTTA